MKLHKTEKETEEIKGRLQNKRTEHDEYKTVALLGKLIEGKKIELMETTKKKKGERDTRTGEEVEKE